MTRQDMAALVAAWVPRLGLSHWQIRQEWVKPADEGAWAQMESEDEYDRATMYLAEDWAAWKPEFAERIVVHELMHLVTRDLEATSEATAAVLPGAAGKLAKARFDHELEGVVDRMAVVLASLAPTRPGSAGTELEVYRQC